MDTTTPEPQNSEPSVTEGRGRKKILVVDDDVVFRELLTWGLKSAGYDALGADNGREAVPVIEKGTPDVIILDLLMPEMDGLRLLNWMKDEAQLSIPTLVLTGIEDRAFAVDALVAGATDVLVKPVELQTLLEKLERLG